MESAKCKALSRALMDEMPAKSGFWPSELSRCPVVTKKKGTIERPSKEPFDCAFNLQACTSRTTRRLAPRAGKPVFTNPYVLSASLCQSDNSPIKLFSARWSIFNHSPLEPFAEDDS